MILSIIFSYSLNLSIAFYTIYKFNIFTLSLFYPIIFILLFFNLNTIPLIRISEYTIILSIYLTNTFYKFYPYDNCYI